jgi:hypothetical protein
MRRGSALTVLPVCVALATGALGAAIHSVCSGGWLRLSLSME